MPPAHRIPSDRSQALDLRWYLPRAEIATILDVGANVGHTVARLRLEHPGAEILAFEPVRASFEVLESLTRPWPEVRCFELALGSAPAAGHIRARGTSSKNRLVARGGRPDVEAVRIVAGAEFCAEHAIGRIGYLKVDTEGHDLEVLRGFEPMIAESRIDLLQVEASMNPENRRHVHLTAFLEFLEPYGYRIFRIYDQGGERRRGPHLRRADLLFVSDPLIRRHVA